MKKLIFLLALPLVFAACKKEKTVDSGNVDKIVGRWEVENQKSTVKMYLEVLAFYSAYGGEEGKIQESINNAKIFPDGAVVEFTTDGRAIVGGETVDYTVDRSENILTLPRKGFPVGLKIATLDDTALVLESDFENLRKVAGEEFAYVEEILMKSGIEDLGDLFAEYSILINFTRK